MQKADVAQRGRAFGSTSRRAISAFTQLSGGGVAYRPYWALHALADTRASMSQSHDRDVSRKTARRGNPFSRRTFLGRFAGAASVAVAGKALAEDQSLDTLMGETDRGESGQTFDQ